MTNCEVLQAYLSQCVFRGGLPFVCARRLYCVFNEMRAKSNEREVKAFRSVPDIDERGGSEQLVVRSDGKWLEQPENKRR
jgi:hypothetical protein